MATMPILGICVFGSYDYPGSSGEHHRTIMVHLFYDLALVLTFIEKLSQLLLWDDIIITILFPYYQWVMHFVNDC